MTQETTFHVHLERRWHLATKGIFINDRILLLKSFQVLPVSRRTEADVLCTAHVAGLLWPLPSPHLFPWLRCPSYSSSLGGSLNLSRSFPPQGLACICLESLSNSLALCTLAPSCLSSPYDQMTVYCVLLYMLTNY